MPEAVEYGCKHFIHGDVDGHARFLVVVEDAHIDEVLELEAGHVQKVHAIGVEAEEEEADALGKVGMPLLEGFRNSK
jgi:hypothetical protein